MRGDRRAFLAGVSSLAFPTMVLADEPGPLIAAASSLLPALEEIAHAFAEAGHPQPRLVFGSSGNIARQIARAAPFELFLSADEAYVHSLAAAGHIEGAGEVYALGRLALLVGHGRAIEVDEALDGLVRALRDGTVKRLAIANPDVAPYGRAAKEALIAVDVWQLAQSRLVIGESVAQAARFLVAGGAEAALIAASLVDVGDLSGYGSVVVASELHRPIVHRMALTPRAGSEARAFSAFMRTEIARAILQTHGFAPPRDSL